VKAALYERHGAAAEVLRGADIERPDPGPGEVRVRVEWTVIPERQAVPLPEGVSPELGASLGVPAMTAYWCLYADGPLTGQTVLIAGGAGAVGHFAIELAKHGGAQVIATVSGPAKAELAARAGADLVVNYREVDAAERIASFAGAVDRVIEVALGANVKLDLAVASPAVRQAL
jgi:NADPH2:quinone reductase